MDFANFVDKGALFVVEFCACGSSCNVFVILDKAEWAAKCSTSWCASASPGAGVGHPIVVKALCGECCHSIEMLVLQPPSGGSS